MKLNNKGWGLGTMLIGVTIILFFLITAVFFSLRLNRMLEQNIVNNDLENNVDYTSYYVDKLNDMIVASNNYIKDNNLELDSGSYIKVDLSTLVALNYLNDVVDPVSERSCIGYTLTTKSVDNIIDIEPYLKCDNYRSKGYEN